jgi:hypothetical protein
MVPPQFVDELGDGALAQAVQAPNLLLLPKNVKSL